MLPAPEIDPSCRAGIYVRLSVEDKHTHTASIETQQLIIARYLEQNPEIIVVQTYIDNGATGTNFHRPGFQQMLSDIEAGLINCVIVKDLSRLGRNVIDTGYYIERYFPMQKVRFIAVNDRYDSSSSDNAHDGIIIPLRNMINEAYAMDIARKIKAQQRQAMKDGKYVGGRTPYGYLKAPDNCHQLIVDPVAAEVVKTMFQWAAEGAGLNTIAVRLNEAGYLSPSHYKRTLGEITHENLVLLDLAGFMIAQSHSDLQRSGIRCITLFTLFDRVLLFIDAQLELAKLQAQMAGEIGDWRDIFKYLLQTFVEEPLIGILLNLNQVGHFQNFFLSGVAHSHVFS